MTAAPLHSGIPAGTGSYLKPRRLRPGSRIAAVSLSFGGPGMFPHRYEAGKRQLEEEFGVSVRETRHALRDPEWLSRHPEARADDLMEAFADSSIDGIFSTIGGDDSIRLLPYLDLEAMRRNPKVFLGYSDTTVTHAACYQAGLVSFYGPAIMAGFAENTGMFPYMVESVRKTLFSPDPVGGLEPNVRGWTVEHLDWSLPGNQAVRRKVNPCTGWVFHQDSGSVEGRLFGGCLEVLDWLRGTSVWPAPQALSGAVLFLETSEEAPPPSQLTRFLRSLAAMGVLHGLAGILLGRPGGQVEVGRFEDYDRALRETVRKEFGLTGMPLVTRMDFGHTDPMLVLPLGVRVRIDSARARVSLEEAAVL